MIAEPGERLADRCQPTFTGRVQFILNPARPTSANQWVSVGERRIPLALIRNPRARRYVLRLRPDGSARVTIPRGGSTAEARRFVERNQDWLARQLQRQAAATSRPKEWMIGTEIFLRGELVKLETGVNGESGMVRLGGELIQVANLVEDLRPAVESQLWRLAARELPARVLEYAALHQFPVRRITVRNQRSRWGSCSRRGTVSLNWRLIQTPPQVRDYIVLHELCHLREMNHSARFWREVERVCPGFEAAEQWLKKHSSLLR